MQRQVTCRVPRGMSHMYLDRTRELRDGGRRKQGTETRCLVSVHSLLMIFLAFDFGKPPSRLDPARRAIYNSVVKEGRDGRVVE